LPRFYFGVREGVIFKPDEEGVEFENLSAAEYAAARTAMEIGRDRLLKGDAREITVEVKDEDGFLLLTVAVSMAVRRTVRALT
jgi:hypothetical protein